MPLGRRDNRVDGQHLHHHVTIKDMEPEISQVLCPESYKALGA